MKIVCKVICDRCDESPISDPSGADIFVIEDEYVIVARCPQCNHPITKWLSYEKAVKIFKNGVKAFSFLTFEEVDLEALV